MKPSNVSVTEIDCNLKRLYYLNHSTQNPWHYIFIGLYSLVTLSGFICNTILLMALKFIHSKERRRGLPLSLQNIRVAIHPRPSEIRRDALISQLAILDLFLCISMPFTAVDVLTKFWPFGSNTELLCKMTKAFPTTIVYASAMAMMLIAFNCYRWTVLPHQRQIPTSKLKYFTLSFIIISALLSSPQYYFTKIFHPQADQQGNIMYNRTYIPPANANQSDVKQTASPFAFRNVNTSNDSFGIKQTRRISEGIDDCTDQDENGWDHVIYCVEDWPFGRQRFEKRDRLMYSIVSFILQLIVPLVVSSFFYCLVYIKLREQSSFRRSSSNWDLNERWQNQEIKRLRKNKFMALISVTYLLTWMPLGMLSILLDANPSIFGTDTSHITIIFISMHLIGMLGATSNPIIYIWKYEHIRKGKKNYCVILLYSCDILQHYYGLGSVE